MKSGYDQFFKNAQKLAEQGQRPMERGRPAVQPSVNRKIQAAPKDKSNSSRLAAEQLRQRVRPQRQKRIPRSIPWKMIGASALGLVIAGLGLWKIEKIEEVVRHVEISMLGSAYAQETKAAAEKPADKKEEGTPSPEERTQVKKEYTQEEINHFSKLNERKRELDAREEELNRLEQELMAQKSELEKRLAELESSRRNISSVLEEKVQADDKKVENLVQMYSNMKPQQAARAFEEMDEGLAIEILGRMKKKNAADIMNLVKPEKVKVLSEKYAGYKRN